nr:peroxidase 2-like [Ipomoea trifida]
MAISTVLLPMVLSLSLVQLAYAQSLDHGFYANTCPNVVGIVKRTTASFISQSPSLAASLLRLHFHDCFVRGCDGSVLLNSTNGIPAEKDAIPNKTLRGFQVIDAAKATINGPYWAVPLGRRDGVVSLSSEALNGLPAPFANITDLKSTFGALGLSVKDLAVLSGKIFISFMRLYNFTGNGDTDPSMDQAYIQQLKAKCPPADVTTTVEMDPGSSRIFNTGYFTAVSARKGLFQSDAALLNDAETKAYVQQQTNSATSTFLKDFAASMVKMGQIGVLTGTAGEIRKNCALRN